MAFDYNVVFGKWQRDIQPNEARLENLTAMHIVFSEANPVPNQNSKSVPNLGFTLV